MPQSIKSVDLEKYVGRWYKQLRYDASFESNMDYVTAGYSLRDGGTVKVVHLGVGWDIGND